MHRASSASNGGGFKVRRLLLLVIAVGALGALFVASTANAAVGVQRWESLTCNANEDKPAPLPEQIGKPEPGIEQSLKAPAGQCTGATPEKLFTQAAGHPTFGITDFRIDTYPSVFGVGGFPTTFLK